MVIALVLVAAWVVLNVVLLGAAAVANQRGQRASRVTVATPAARRAPVFAAASVA